MLNSLCVCVCILRSTLFREQADRRLESVQRFWTEGKAWKFDTHSENLAKS